MKNFVGTKIVKAELTSFKNYLEIKYGKEFVYNGKMDMNKLVYVAFYSPAIGENEDDYISCSPPEIFSKCYREVDHKEIELCLKSNDNLFVEENNK